MGDDQSDVSGLSWFDVGFRTLSPNIWRSDVSDLGALRLALWGQNRRVMSASMVGLWGSDLWDRYDGVVAHVNRGTEELGGG